MTRTTLAVAAVAAFVALTVPALAVPAKDRLVGTVGPGFTITLKHNGTKVARLKAGRYMLVVNDKASAHNFVLAGPGINRAVTTVSFIGTKTIVMTLKKGNYSFFCAPHKSFMNGKFTVS